jgi:hypothetical protein
MESSNPKPVSKSRRTLIRYNMNGRNVSIRAQFLGVIVLKLVLGLYIFIYFQRLVSSEA